MADPWDGLLGDWASTLAKLQTEWDQRDDGIWTPVAQAPVKTTLYTRARKMLWSREDAQDVVQTTLFQLAVGRTYKPSTRGPIGFKFWIFGALDNRIASFLEDTKTSREDVSLDLMQSPKRVDGRAEERRLIRNLDLDIALADCDSVLRSIIKLTLEGFKAGEIAPLLGLKEPQVRLLKFRGLKKLASQRKSEPR